MISASSLDRFSRNADWFQALSALPAALASSLSSRKLHPGGCPQLTARGSKAENLKNKEEPGTPQPGPILPCCSPILVVLTLLGMTEIDNVTSSGNPTSSLFEQGEQIRSHYQQACLGPPKQRTHLSSLSRRTTRIKEAMSRFERYSEVDLGSLSSPLTVHVLSQLVLYISIAG